MKDLNISKVYLAAISDRDAFRNEIEKGGQLLQSNQNQKPHRPKWTDKSPFGEIL